MESYTYVFSKRGTKLILYDGNSYTPNDKEGLEKRNYKCSQYYKAKCKARLSTNKNGVMRIIYGLHSHNKVFSTQKEIENKINYR